MYESFETLPFEKKIRIIEAGIEEFALKGYDMSSTNIITKNAGISKGLLFHYFGSKKNFYLYIIDYIMNYFLKKYSYMIEDKLSSDIFERLVQRGLRKLKIAKEEPLKYEVLFGAFINPSEEIKLKIQEWYNKIYSNTLSQYLDDIETSSFRKNVDSKKAIEAIVLFTEALSNKYLKIIKNVSASESKALIEKLMTEINEYMDIIKYGVYER